MLTNRREDMMGLFDPLITQIIELVNDQVSVADKQSEKIHQVFLVGGFGESPYLNLRMKEWCNARNISLKNPPAWYFLTLPTWRSSF